MADYSIIKASLDEISSRIVSNRKRVQQAQAQVSTAAADLAAMATVYASIVAEIDVDAAAAPADTVLQFSKAEKDKLVAEFSALQTTVDSIKAAIDVFSV